MLNEKSLNIFILFTLYIILTKIGIWDKLVVLDEVIIF